MTRRRVGLIRLSFRDLAIILGLPEDVRIEDADAARDTETLCLRVSGLLCPIVTAGDPIPWVTVEDLR